MDQVKTDMVMRFVLAGQDVYAECALDVAKGDDMMDGFAAADYQNYSNFFEVQSFRFGLKLNSQDKSLVGQQGGKAGQQPAPKAAATEEFARWRSAKGDDYKKIKFPLDFDEFSFTRLIDAASPIFFQACCNSQSFDSAVLVKRVSEGDRGALSRPAVGFLRLEFTNVLITKVDWDDGDMVKEDCQFICREMTVQYKQQAPDGHLLAPTGAEWKQLVDGQPVGNGRGR